VIASLAAALLLAGVGGERPVVVMTPEAVGSPAPPAWVGAVIAEELPRALDCLGPAGRPARRAAAKASCSAW